MMRDAETQRFDPECTRLQHTVYRAGSPATHGKKRFTRVGSRFLRHEIRPSAIELVEI
jgi:hypothetical protein